MLNRTSRVGLAERKLDLHFRASLYHPKLGWVSSGHWFGPNAGPIDSWVETRAQKGAYNILRGVYRVGVSSAEVDRLPSVVEWVSERWVWYVVG